MKKDIFKTKVIFRKFKDGEIIAIFPEIMWSDDPPYLSSYLHVGQHGACDYGHLRNLTKPAKPKEYADLMAELESIGYNLDVRKKRVNGWRR